MFYRNKLSNQNICQRQSHGLGATVIRIDVGNDYSNFRNLSASAMASSLFILT